MSEIIVRENPCEKCNIREFYERCKEKCTVYRKWNQYQQVRESVINECLKTVKDRLLTYSVGDDVIIDLNMLNDELVEIAEQLKEKKNDD